MCLIGRRRGRDVRVSEGRWLARAQLEEALLHRAAQRPSHHDLSVGTCDTRPSNIPRTIAVNLARRLTITIVIHGVHL